MEKSNDELREYVLSLPISEEQKATLLGYWTASQKVLYRVEFQLKRTIQDKAIIVNLLNRTIEELKLRQAEVESTNTELLSQKQLVEEQSSKLSEQLQMLEKSYAELEQFSYIASHDLKSPLRTIASYASLMKRRNADQLNAEAIEFIDYIIKGASHMNEIIRDLLEYAGIRKENFIEAVDTNEVLKLVVRNLSIEIAESQAVINFSKLPVLHAHQIGLLQLFQNLIANAIKFRGDEPPKVHIQVQERHQFWQFNVSDNGLGLDENFQEKAFLPFQRVNHLEKPGTGMGLAICKKIVKLHGGDIWFRSVIGKGTTFYFTIAKQAVEMIE